MHESPGRRERFRVYRIGMVAGAVIAVLWFFWQARGALLPFAIGLVLAYLLSPLVNRVQLVIPNRGWLGRARRTLAIVLVYLVAISILAATVATVGPKLINETLDLIDTLPELAETARDESDYWNQKYEETVPEDLRQNIEDNLDQVGSAAGDAAASALTMLFGTVRRVISFILGLLILPLWLFYVLKDQNKAFDFFYRLFPMEIRQDVRNIVGITDRILGAYVRGQLFLGFVVGVVTFIGLYILDVQYAVALAVLAGLFEMIPILGPWLSFIAAAIVVLATDPDKFWAIAILFLMIQQLENTFLVPKIQGDAVEMNPAVIMVLLVVGGAVFGLLGVIVIVPLAAIARDVFKYVYARLSEEGNLPETPL
jgi:predicted PurR-regulated permease PerM